MTKLAPEWVRTSNPVRSPARYRWTTAPAYPTTDVIYVLIPDNTTCSAAEISPADLQHVIGIRLGPAENLGSNLPREDLHLSLCENSLQPTLIADRRVYWAEITPLLQRWQSVNNTGCPHCHRLIRVNMSRHLRASHTDNQCFWRCPVSPCHLWFSSELNGKDHLERIHGFREGQGWSFYECLRRFGMVLTISRAKFSRRYKETFFYIYCNMPTLSSSDNFSIQW